MDNAQESKAYSVGIAGTDIVIPRFCTCCMRPTQRVGKVKYDRNYFDVDDMNWKVVKGKGNMPLCEKCAAHKRRGYLARGLIGGVSVALGGLMMILLMLYGLGRLSSFIISGCAAAPVCYCLMRFLKTKALPKNHSARCESVKMYKSSMPTNLPGLSDRLPDIELTFTNGRYARIFKEANEDNVIYMRDVYEENTARSTNILKLIERPGLWFFKLLVIFAAAAVFIVLTMRTGSALFAAMFVSWIAFDISFCFESPWPKIMTLIFIPLEIITFIYMMCTLV